MKQIGKKSLLMLVILTFFLCACQKEDAGIKSGDSLLEEEQILAIHKQSGEVLKTATTAGGVLAKVSEMTPYVLYLSVDQDEITQIYDVYRVIFTSPLGNQTERYMVVYYRNVKIKNADDGELAFDSDPPVSVGFRVEASATAMEGGYIFGYKSQTEMEKDVLSGVDTKITHQITSFE